MEDVGQTKNIVRLLQVVRLQRIKIISDTKKKWLHLREGNYDLIINYALFNEGKLVH